MSGLSHHVTNSSRPAAAPLVSNSLRQAAAPHVANSCLPVAGSQVSLSKLVRCTGHAAACSSSTSCAGEHAAAAYCNCIMLMVVMGQQSRLQRSQPSKVGRGAGAPGEQGAKNELPIGRERGMGRQKGAPQTRITGRWVPERSAHGGGRGALVSSP
jgi:hypothetical protein